MSKLASKALKTVAKKNVNATRKVVGEEDETLIKGAPLDHAIKREPYAGAKVGMSKGVTKNMDNYESLRVDVWLTDEVAQGETVEDAYNRISAVLTEVLEETVSEIVGDEDE